MKWQTIEFDQGKVVSVKQSETEYPKLMTDGTAHIPQSFWGYVYAVDKNHEDKLILIGYVESNLESMPKHLIGKQYATKSEPEMPRRTL